MQASWLISWIIKIRYQFYFCPLLISHGKTCYLDGKFNQVWSVAWTDLQVTICPVVNAIVSFFIYNVDFVRHRTFQFKVTITAPMLLSKDVCNNLINEWLIALVAKGTMVIRQVQIRLAGLVPILKLCPKLYLCYVTSSFISRSLDSYQIRKIVGCACTGNAGNVFPAADFKGNR